VPGSSPKFLYVQIEMADRVMAGLVPAIPTKQARRARVSEMPGTQASEATPSLEDDYGRA